MSDLVNSKHYFSKDEISKSLLEKINSPFTSKEVLLERLTSVRNRLYYLKKESQLSVLGSEAYGDAPCCTLMAGMPTEFITASSNTLSALASNYENPGTHKREPTIEFQVGIPYTSSTSKLATETLTQNSFNTKVTRSLNDVVFQYSSALNQLINDITDSLMTQVKVDPLSSMEVVSQVEQPDYDVSYYSNTQNSLEQIEMISRNISYMEELSNVASLIASNGYTDISLPTTNSFTGNDSESVLLTNQYINNYNISICQFYALMVNIILCTVLQMYSMGTVLSEIQFEKFKASLTYYYTYFYQMKNAGGFKTSCAVIRKTAVGCAVSTPYLSDFFSTSNNSFALVKKNAGIFVGSCIFPEAMSYISVNNSGYDSIGNFQLSTDYMTTLTTVTVDATTTLVNSIPNFNYYSTLNSSASSSLSDIDVPSTIASPYGEPSDPTQVSYNINLPAIRNTRAVPVNLMGSTMFSNPVLGINISLGNLLNPTSSTFAYTSNQINISTPTVQTKSIPEEDIFFSDDDYAQVPTTSLSTSNAYQNLADIHASIMQMANSLVLTQKSVLQEQNPSLNPIYLGLQSIVDSLNYTQQPVFDDLSYATTISHSIKFKNLDELMDTMYQYIDRHKSTTKPSVYYKKETRVKFIQKLLSIMNSHDCNVNLNILLNLGGDLKLYTSKELPEKFRSGTANFLSYPFASLLRIASSISDDLHPDVKGHINKILS